MLRFLWLTNISTQWRHQNWSKSTRNCGSKAESGARDRRSQPNYESPMGGPANAKCFISSFYSFRVQHKNTEGQCVFSWSSFQFTVFFTFLRALKLATGP
jgi:hypothetical protein